jgi:hypothetical protein
MITNEKIYVDNESLVALVAWLKTSGHKWPEDTTGSEVVTLRELNIRNGWWDVFVRKYFRFLLHIYYEVSYGAGSREAEKI